MEKTFVIIRPDGVRRHLAGSITQRFEAKGLAIVEMKFETITPESAKEHYQHLTEHSLFDGLIDYMTFGSVVYPVLASEEVIDIARKIVGATKAADAVPGTIRGDYTLPGIENIIHAFDSRDVVVKETIHLFPPFDVDKPSGKAAK